jgi:hypothetical protein
MIAAFQQHLYTGRPAQLVTECLSDAFAIPEIARTIALRPDRVVAADLSFPKQDVEQVRGSLPVSVLSLP